MSEFIKVHCGIPNGVVLRVFEESEGPFGVISHLCTDSVTLKAGENEVDSGFFDKWMETNSDIDLVKNHFIERKT